MNRLDQKIVLALKRNGRTSISKIAKKAGVSIPRAHYRFAKLLQEKIIRGFYPLINFSSLNYTAFRLMFQFSSTNKQKRKEFIDFIVNDKNCLWAAECGGRWDFLVDFIEQDIYAFRKKLSKIEETFRTINQSYDFLIINQLYDFEKDMLVYSKKQKINGVLGNKKTKLTLKDLKILKVLVINGRASYKEITDYTGIHPKTIQKRMEYLKKNKVLLGIRTHFDAQKIGFETFKILIKLNELESIEKIVNYLYTSEEAIGAVEVFGLWNLEAEIQTKDYGLAKEFLFSLKEKFANNINDFEIIPIIKEFPYKYIPT